MIREEFVNMLARKIYTEEINPKTSKPFVVEDIKIEEYKEPVKKAIEILIEREVQDGIS